MSSSCLYPEQIQNSLHILGYTENTQPSSLKELNKRYHILALKHHPDKCVHTAAAAAPDATPAATEESTEKFKDINHAHKCLVDYFYSGSGFAHYTSHGGYDSILQLFIKTMISKHDIHADSIQTLVHHIITKGIQSAITVFRSMEKQTALMIYDILSKNQELFGISRETMDEITKIMEEKTSADIVIRLNPSLLAMLLDRVYILHENGHTYYIPLWHSELHFKIGSTRGRSDNRDHVFCSKEAENNPDVDSDAEVKAAAVSGGELIVLCDPELPDNVSIDEHNNLYISLDVSVNELFKMQVLPVVINEETKANRIIYYIHAADVTLRTDITQRVLLHGCGGIASIHSSTIHTNDMYKVDKRANVYANIRLVV